MKIKEALAAKNHRDAIKFIEDLVKEKKEIDEKTILHVHELLLQSIDENAGRFRVSDVKIGGAFFRPPHFTEVRSKTLELLEWLKANPDKLNGIELAAIFHHKFVYIHPFAGGNGRTARLLMNYILMRHGFPFIAEVEFNNREKYYRALSDADLGFKQDFVNFIATRVERAIDVNRHAREKEKPEILSLAEASRYAPYSQEYLSLLSRKGAIGAFKQGRNWSIARDDLDRYVKSIEAKRERSRSRNLVKRKKKSRLPTS